MNQTKINTGLFFLYLFTLFLYWTKTIEVLNKNSVMFLISTTVMVVMTGVYYSQVIGTKRIGKGDFSFLAIFTVLMVLHMFFSQTSFLQGLNIIFSVYLYMVLPNVQLQTEKIYKVVFGSFLVLTIVFFPQVIRGLLDLSSDYTAFKGVFLSANSIGDLGVSALMAFFLLNKSHQSHPPKMRRVVFLVLYLIVIIISTHQRAALLFLLTWLVGYYLLEKKWNKKLIFVGFVIALTVVGSYMVFSEVISMNKAESDIELFGKEASSRGRSEQIFLAFQLYDITPWGEGRGVVNEAVQDETRYAIHNTFVASLFEYGYLIFIFYFIYWFRLFNRGSSLTASFILAYHIILFFEPENFFSNQLLPFIAFSLVFISEGDNTRMRYIAPSKTKSVQLLATER